MIITQHMVSKCLFAVLNMWCYLNYTVFFTDFPGNFIVHIFNQVSWHLSTAFSNSRNHWNTTWNSIMQRGLSRCSFPGLCTEVLWSHKFLKWICLTPFLTSGDNLKTRKCHNGWGARSFFLPFEFAHLVSRDIYGKQTLHRDRLSTC